MKKLLSILFILLTQNITSQTIVNGITLPEARTTDLIICNDNKEFYMNNEIFPLPWTKKNLAASDALLNGLIANKLVLCTKSLWRNVQFIGEMWKDFATLSKQDLISKYKTLSKQPEQEFLQKIDEYEPCINEINKMYENINLIIKDSTNKDLSEISNTINYLIDGSKNTYKWKTDKYIKNQLQLLFTIYTLYQIILANNYTCKEITDDFILFIPKQLLEQPVLDQKLIQTIEQENITDKDIWLGLKYSSCNDYKYLEFLTQDQTINLANRLKDQKKAYDKLLDNKTIGILLYDALEKLIIKKSKITKDFKDYLVEILPNFNIFLTGHGSKNYFTAELSTELTNNKSEFLDILTIFNNHLLMKSLTIYSCYPAGSKLVNSFDITSKIQNPILEKLTYPIIIIGITLASVSSSYTIAKLPPFNNENIKNYIYQAQQKYGPGKDNNQEPFIRFFNFLNNTTTYEKFETTTKSKNPTDGNIKHYKITNVNKNTNEAFTTPTPLFLEAVNVLCDIYDNKKQINKNMLSDYALIKYPNTEWFVPADFNKIVKKLSSISMLAKETVNIIPETQVILMDANIIKATIVIPNKNIPAFISANYLKQSYIFDKIVINQTTKLETFIKQFFTIQNIAEQISIIIKELIIGSLKFSNVFIFVHDDIFSQQKETSFKNGYAFYTENRYQMIYWQENQSFDTAIKESISLSPEYLEGTVSAIEDMVKSNNETYLKTEYKLKTNNPKDTKGFIVESTSPISQEKIKELEKHLQNKPKNKDIYEKSLKIHDKEKLINSPKLA